MVNLRQCFWIPRLLFQEASYGVVPLSLDGSMKTGAKKRRSKRIRVCSMLKEQVHHTFFVRGTCVEQWCIAGLIDHVDMVFVSF